MTPLRTADSMHLSYSVEHPCAKSSYKRSYTLKASKTTLIKIGCDRFLPLFVKVPPIMSDFS